jgi:hypothetical protein
MRAADLRFFSDNPAVFVLNPRHSRPRRGGFSEIGLTAGIGGFYPP